MRQILAVLVAITTVAIIQGLFYTFRFLGEKKRDELRRRLQTNQGTEMSVQLNLLRRGQLAQSASPNQHPPDEKSSSTGSCGDFFALFFFKTT